VIVGLFVPKRPPLAPSEESRGVLAGVRFLLRDPFLRVLGITALFLNMFGQMLSASLLYLAREDFDSARIGGAFFAAFGAGAVAGSIAAMRLVRRHEPIRLAAVALLCMTAPMLLLGVDLPFPAVMLVLFVSAVFGPIINAPLIATIMTRSPEALRAKVMSAVITCALVAGPLGLLVVGPLLGDLGARSVLLVVAVGQLVATLPFVWIAFHKGMDQAPSAAPATSQP
jgi:predicted MFS family arabinose efflux permease